jgi:hypothetical protein
MTDFSIIQGDDKSIIVEFTGAVSQEIVGFYFSSKKLGVSKYFGEKIEDKWIISFTSEETRNFPDGVASFDITAKTSDGQTLTGVYHGVVCIKEKDNSIF